MNKNLHDSLRVKKIWPLFIFIPLFFSCDILRSSPYEVNAWTPGEGFHSDPAGIKISLLLSHESDHVRTELAFSLTEDRRALKGDFSWEGSRLVFIPAAPLQADRNYLITLGTGAQDTKGLSLENKFEAVFTTRTPGGKLRLIGTDPEHNGVISESRGEFRLFFSEPVYPESCTDHISFSPSTPGSWRLEDENRTACFTPREPWQSGSLYKVLVESDFASVSGSALGTEYTSLFAIGADRERPVLLKVLALLPDGEEEIVFDNQWLPPGIEYGAWESFYSLCLVFSEPVDVSGLKNLLVIEPSISLIAESPPSMSDHAIFRFAEDTAWGSSLLFRLGPGVRDGAGNQSTDEYVFRIVNNGPLSKAPALVGIRIPMAPGCAENQEALDFTPGDLLADLPIADGEGRYPFSDPTPAWVELYFETAPGTDIDLFSVMDLFRVVCTNQALVFSPRSIRTEDFSLPNPHEGWEAAKRLEIRGLLTNTVNSGIVTFRIAAGLRDMRGNRSTADFSISLVK